LPDASALNELHALIVAHGKRYCRPIPRCNNCPLLSGCRFAELDHET
jgi:endonuclease-3 related protein